MKRIGVDILIDREKVENKDVFIASSPEINVLAEGKTIDEAKKKFIEGMKIHLKNFPEDRNLLIQEDEKECEMPMLTRIFL